MTQILAQVMQERGIAQGSIPLEEIKLFCQNVQTLEVTRMRSPLQELQEPVYEDLSSEFYDPDSLAQHYVALRAVEAYRDSHSGRYPGFTNDDMFSNFAWLKNQVSSILKEVGND